MADFDPSGWQMAISIGRKLQAFRDLLFPTPEFEVRPVALTGEQARALELPSTPLKATEKRADRWRERMNWEQTEVDALATLAPDTLRSILIEAVAPFLDRGLAGRVRDARDNWEARAQEALEDQLSTEHRSALRDHMAGQIEDIRARLRELEDQARMTTADLEIDLPTIEIPEAEIDESLQGSPLVSSAWPWAEQTRALKARKAYDNGAADGAA